MKRIPLVLGLLMVSSGCLYAQELTLEEILTRHFQAGNMEKLQEVRTIVMTGLRVQQDIMPMKIIRKRPDRYLLDYYVADLHAFQGYDGERSWTTAPWTGNAAPQALQGSRAAEMKYQSEFDGLLYGWQEKGIHLEEVGTDTLDTGEAFRIKLVRPDSAIQYYYIDASDFLLRKQESFRTYQGQEITIETYFRDYREVAGIPFAFLVETHYPGRSVNFEVECIELNEPVDDAVFRMPAQ